MKKKKHFIAAKKHVRKAIMLNVCMEVLVILTRIMYIVHILSKIMQFEEKRRIILRQICFLAFVCTIDVLTVDMQFFKIRF